MSNVSIKKNAFLNVIKQACSILFPLITYPYISRVLGSSSYGVYSFSDSIVSYAVLIAGLGISTYAVREGAPIRQDKEKINQFSSELFSINIISTIISYLLLVILTIVSTKIYADRNIIFIRSIMIILTTIGMDWVNNIYEDFTYLTVRYILFQSISLILMFIFVRSNSDIIAYTIITVLASAGGNLLNIFYFRRYVRIRLVIKWKSLCKHVKPIMILFANNVAVAVYVNSDITMLGFYTANTNVGVYSLASKIYNLAKLMVNAIIMVMIPRLSYIVKKEDIYKTYLSKTAKYLLYACLPIVCGFVILSKQILYLVGGNSYLKGALSLSILSLTIVGAIGGSFFGNCILLEHRKENIILFATTVSATLNVALNFLFIPRFGICGAAITTFIAEFVAFIIQASYSRKYISLKRFLDRSISYCLFGCVGIILICSLVSLLISNMIISLVVAIILSIAVYLFFIFKDKEIKKEILGFLIRR